MTIREIPVGKSPTLKKRITEAPKAIEGAVGLIAECGDVEAEPVIADLHRGAQRLLAAAKKMQAGAEAILQNPMQTSMKNKAQARDLVSKLGRAEIKPNDDLKSRVGRAREALVASTLPKPVEDLQHAEELRRVLRETKEKLDGPVELRKTRASFVGEAIRDCDEAFIRSVLSAGSYRAAGLRKTEFDVLLDRYRRERHPRTMKQIRGIDDAVRRFEIAEEQFVKWWLGMFADDEPGIKNAEELEEKAKEAIKNAAA